MPPKKTINAPANRIYKKQPRLEQTVFPNRKRTQRTYGSHPPRPIPKLLQQETLTQLGYVVRGEDEGGIVEEEEDEVEEVEEDEVEEVEDDDDVQITKIVPPPKRKGRGGKPDVLKGIVQEEDDEVEIIKPTKARRVAKRRAVEDLEEEVVDIVKPKKNRRKTMGDAVEDQDEEGHIQPNKKKAKASKNKRRKTTGDKASSPMRDQTTITQIYRSFEMPAEDEEEAREEEKLPPQIEDIDTSFDDSVFDVPSSSQVTQPPSTMVSKSRQVKMRMASPELDSNPMGSMGPPQTPKRTIDRIIPSSESPETPLSTRSLSYARSPLADLSVNSSIPLNIHPGQKAMDISHRTPRIEIKDTFDTDESQLLDLPKLDNLQQPPRLEVQDTFNTEETQMLDLPKSSPKRSSPVKTVRFVLEIPDSDDDEDLMDSPTKTQDSISSDVVDEESALRDTCYGEIGEETQFKISRMYGSPSPSARMDESQGKENSPILGEEGNFIHSPFLTRAVTFKIEEVHDEEDDEEEINSQERPTQFEAKTQFTESQRLHTQHYITMAPRTIGSDVFVSLPAQQVTDIISRKRDHDIRNWPYPSTVARLWIYATKPVAALKYMAEIGEAKRPGDIGDETGLGNKVFNGRKATSNWHAYEIKELYELADPLPLAKLVENEWLQEAPKKHMPVRPAVIDCLMANLMPPTFDQCTQEDPVSTTNDTQEANAQLLSTLKQFTHVDASRVPDSSPPLVDERIPSSHEEVTLPPLVKPVVPLDALSQATTVDLTQTQQVQTQPLTQFHTPRKPPPTTEIIWESPTRPVLSSTPARLPTPRTGGSVGSCSGESDPVAAPLLIASSQVVSETQMQKDGMFYDSIPMPPMFIQDSDDEDGDEDE